MRTATARKRRKANSSNTTHLLTWPALIKSCQHHGGSFSKPPLRLAVTNTLARKLVHHKGCPFVCRNATVWPSNVAVRAIMDIPCGELACVQVCSPQGM